MAQPVPEGFHTLTPYITVKDAQSAIEFYKQAFGAEEIHVSKGPDGKIMHAQLQIGDSRLMLNDEFPDWGVLSPMTTGAVQSSMIHVYMNDIDSVFNRAIAAGATVAMPMMDQFWGDRSGQLKDPFGHKWMLSMHIKDMTHAEMEEAGRQSFSK